MENIQKEILEFMSTRPNAKAIVGYGSGINKQKGQENRKPQIDLIIVVDDLKKWHLENIQRNPKDYSFSSKIFFKIASEKMLKSGGRICYMTYIPFHNREYKIGTIQENDFTKDLDTWETFYMAGRMQKPILIVKSEKEIEEKINLNREYAIATTNMLVNKNISERDYYITLAGLSYIGDTRMGIAENPDKVKNIVDGSLTFYQEKYGTIRNIETKLPKELQNYLNNNKNIPKKEAINNFFKEKNKKQSLAQTIKGLFTTGPIKSVKYVGAKIKRRKRK